MEHTDVEQKIENKSLVDTMKKRLKNGKNWMKGKLNPKTLIAVCVALIVLIGAYVGVGYATNNYTTPVRHMEKLENKKSISFKAYLKTALENMGATNAGEIVKIMCESDDFLDEMDEFEESYEEAYEKKQDEYGDDFKIVYAIEDKLKLEKSDLRNYQKQYRQYISLAKEGLAEMEDYTSSDWNEMAENVGLTRTQVKKLVSALETMVDDIGRLEVTDGYELSIVKTVTGNMLDEPVETDMTIQVVKVNGRWVNAASFIDGLSLF